MHTNCYSNRNSEHTRHFARTCNRMLPGPSRIPADKFTAYKHSHTLKDPRHSLEGSVQAGTHTCTLTHSSTSRPGKALVSTNTCISLRPSNILEHNLFSRGSCSGILSSPSIDLEDTQHNLHTRNGKLKDPKFSLKGRSLKLRRRMRIFYLTKGSWVRILVFVCKHTDTGWDPKRMDMGIK